MQAATHAPLSFCGEIVAKEDLSLIRQVCDGPPNLCFCLSGHSILNLLISILSLGRELSSTCFQISPMRTKSLTPRVSLPKGLAGLPIHHALMSPRDILWHFAL